MENKKFYWLKFQKDFFKSLRVKKLRKLSKDKGDTYVIIYLMLQLFALPNNGFIEYKGVFDSFEEEMAEEIGEDAEDIAITVQYLLSCGLMTEENGQYFLPYVSDNTGSESDSAERVRNHRKIQKSLQCNTNVTECNDNVTECNNKNVTCNTEKEKEIEIEIDKEIEIEKDNKKESRAKSTRFVPPTLEEVKNYCLERNNGVDAVRWYNFYSAKGWMVGKNKMKDWKAAVRTWETDIKSRAAPSRISEVDDWV